MIIGAHVIAYTGDVNADRAFLRDVVGLKYVDAGNGWLIFALPPAEIALHPGDEERIELYLMTDDLKREVARLTEAGVVCSEISEQRWGSLTHLRLPSGAKVGLYEPHHPTALNL